MKNKWDNLKELFRNKSMKKMYLISLLIFAVLAGVFMLLEGSLHVGDRVEVDEWQGIVTDIGIRTTRITNDNGEVKNSQQQPYQRYCKHEQERLLGMVRNSS